ncbi:MAG: arginine--tRNA ligase, partial [Candidatus Aminicenantes bacterium]|nr:arginine--tRNA ligase [Candidatus Aminicenantes bacterium]
GLRYLGYGVEVQNYIDDTGVQVADVVWGLLQYRKMNIQQIKGQDNLASYLWDLYSDVHRMVEEKSEITQQIREVLKRIELKKNPEFEMSRFISNTVLENHIRLMESVGIRYNLLVRESDIIELEFFELASKILKEKKVMYPSEDPVKEGCWVIKYNRENIEKIIIRSDHTITYIGKDIAYALWKVGLLGKDFFYQSFYEYPDSEKLYITGTGSHSESPAFGNARQIYNVIGKRQSYLQNIISQVLGSLDNGQLGKHFIHFSYEMVSLTSRCVQDMGFEISERDKAKPFVDVSGRKGIAVKAEELIKKLTDKSLEEVRLRNPGLDDESADQIARDIAIGALRYFMIKFNSNSVIAFDFQDALSFEGDSGPYLQYTLVRLNSILKKMGDQLVDPDIKELDMELLNEKESGIFYEILLQVSQMDLQIEFAIESKELSVITSYTYSLCQKFNHYYHLFPIISEQRLDIKKLRLSLILLIKKKLEVLFGIIGIPIPERM